VPAAAGKYVGGKRLSGFIGFKGCVRRPCKSVVKYGSSTVEVPLILRGLSTDEVGGIDGVAVKCLDIVQVTPIAKAAY